MMDRITSGNATNPSYGAALITGRSVQAETEEPGAGDQFVKTSEADYTEQLMALSFQKARYATSKEESLSVGKEMLLVLEEQVAMHGVNGRTFMEQAEKLYLANGERLSY